MNKKTIGDIHNNGSVTVIQIEVNIDKDGIKAFEKTNYDEEHKPKINESKLKRWSHWAFGKILAILPYIIYLVKSILSKPNMP